VGRVAEWFKAHAWKVCVRQKRTVGSNPTPSVSVAADEIVRLEHVLLTEHLESSLKGCHVRADGHSRRVNRDALPIDSLRVDADPVIANHGPLLLSLERGDDAVRGLQRHVAVDAPPRECVALLRKETAALLLMAREAFLRELGHVALLAMDVVACDARHLRRAEALASGQKRHLIAVDVHRDVGPGWRQIQIVVEALPGDVEKRRHLGLAETGVALPARFHFSFAALAGLDRLHQVADAGREGPNGI
jgi:hypothetical protein